VSQDVGLKNCIGTQADLKRVRRHFDVIMERIVFGLRDNSCIPLEEKPTAKSKYSHRGVLAIYGVHQHPTFPASSLALPTTNTIIINNNKKIQTYTGKF